MPTDLPAPRILAARPTPIWWLLFLACPVLLAMGLYALTGLLDWAVAQPGIDHAELTRRILAVVLPAVVFGLTAAIVAVRYVRYTTAVSFQTQMTGLRNRHIYHKDMVRLIADNRPGSTMIIDGEERLWFVNSQAVKDIDLSPQDAVGRPFEKTCPEATVLRVKPLLQRARHSGIAVEAIAQTKSGGKSSFIKTHVVPLPPIANMTNAVMVNEEDVTNILVEREARERMFRQVVDTLVAVVDRRDPFAAGHSARVGQIARRIAEGIGLDAAQIETTEIAGLLMNFGKVLVPRVILTKSSALTPEELKQVRESLLTSADILALIGFSQPVVPTLRQALERYDGSGIPNGLSGDSILITARIITVANAFVALVSARAHRPGIGVRAALAALQQDAGRGYDGNVVAALGRTLGSGEHNIEWLPVG